MSPDTRTYLTLDARVLQLEREKAELLDLVCGLDEWWNIHDGTGPRAASLFRGEQTWNDALTFAIARAEGRV